MPWSVYATLTFVLQRIVGHFTLGALLQISIVQDFMVGRQAAVPKFICERGEDSGEKRLRSVIKDVRHHMGRRESLTEEAISRGKKKTNKKLKTKEKISWREIYRWAEMLCMR